MPRRSRAPRARKSRVNPAKALARMKALALDMEEPLHDAADYVLALRLVGDGLIAVHDETGRAVVVTAASAARRLEELRKTWERMFALNGSPRSPA